MDCHEIKNETDALAPLIPAKYLIGYTNNGKTNHDFEHRRNSIILTVKQVIYPPMSQQLKTSSYNFVVNPIFKVF